MLEQIKDLKNNRDKQLENKDKQLLQMQNLLDQQQRLALQDKKLLEEYKAENDSLKALKMPTQETEFKHLDNQQIVLPIKDSNVLKMVQDTLLDSLGAGRRNYTIFQVGKATLLRVSDVMGLKQADIFNPDGSIKQNAFIHDRKTGKPNTLYLKPIQTELLFSLY